MSMGSVKGFKAVRCLIFMNHSGKHTTEDTVKLSSPIQSFAYFRIII